MSATLNVFTTNQILLLSLKLLQKIASRILLTMGIYWCYCLSILVYCEAI